MSSADTRRVELITAILVGGPDRLPGGNIVTVPPHSDKLKIPRGGGYEHFKRTSQEEIISVNTRAVIFEWTDRTTIAE